MYIFYWIFFVGGMPKCNLHDLLSIKKKTRPTLWRADWMIALTLLYNDTKNGLSFIFFLRQELGKPCCWEWNRTNWSRADENSWGCFIKFFFETSWNHEDIGIPQLLKWVIMYLITVELNSSNNWKRRNWKCLIREIPDETWASPMSYWFLEVLCAPGKAILNCDESLVMSGVQGFFKANRNCSL